MSGAAAASRSATTAITRTSRLNGAGLRSGTYPGQQQVVDGDDAAADAVADDESVDESDETAEERHAVARKVDAQQGKVRTNRAPALQHERVGGHEQTKAQHQPKRN